MKEGRNESLSAADKTVAIRICKPLKPHFDNALRTTPVPFTHLTAFPPVCHAAERARISRDDSTTTFNDHSMPLPFTHTDVVSEASACIAEGGDAVAADSAPAAELPPSIPNGTHILRVCRGMRSRAVASLRVCLVSGCFVMLWGAVVGVNDED